MKNTRMLKRLAIGTAPEPMSPARKFPLPVNLAGNVGDVTQMGNQLRLNVVLCPHPGAIFDLGMTSAISNIDGLWFSTDCHNYDIRREYGQAIEVSVFDPAPFDTNIKYGSQVIIRNVSVKRGDSGQIWFNATEFVLDPDRTADTLLVNEFIPQVKFCTSPTHLSKMCFGQMMKVSDLKGEMRYDDKHNSIIDVSWKVRDMQQSETIHIEASIYQSKYNKLLDGEHTNSWLYENLERVFKSDLTLVGYLHRSEVSTKRKFHVKWLTLGLSDHIEHFLDRMSHVS